MKTIPENLPQPMPPATCIDSPHPDAATGVTTPNSCTAPLDLPPQVDPRVQRRTLARARAKFLALLRAGSSHKAALAKAGVSWGHIQRRKQFDKEFYENYRKAVDAQAETRRIAIADRLHKRAMAVREVETIETPKGVTKKTRPARNESVLLAHAAALDPRYRRDAGALVSYHNNSLTLNADRDVIQRTVLRILEESTRRTSLVPVKVRNAEVVAVKVNGVTQPEHSLQAGDTSTDSS